MPLTDADETIRRIGRRVAELRDGKGWTQATLSEKLAVSTPYVASVEGGHENLTIRSLCKLADVLDVPVRDLFKAPKRRAPRRRGRPKGKAATRSSA